jgi:uncharacterized protein YbbC (DUF1343 family)
MPTLQTAFVYPGMGIFEGTSISEGRGTTRPFEISGVGNMTAELLVKRLENVRLDIM